MRKQLYRFTFPISETENRIKIKEFNHCGYADNYAWRYKQCKIERINHVNSCWVLWKYSVPWGKL